MISQINDMILLSPCHIVKRRFHCTARIRNGKCVVMFINKLEPSDKLYSGICMVNHVNLSNISWCLQIT